MLINSFCLLTFPFKIGLHINIMDSVKQHHNIFILFDKIISVILILSLMVY